jgi:hypothetical protein
VKPNGIFWLAPSIPYPLLPLLQQKPQPPFVAQAVIPVLAVQSPVEYKTLGFSEKAK